MRADRGAATCRGRSFELGSSFGRFGEHVHDARIALRSDTRNGSAPRQDEERSRRPLVKG
jgi:hypothetical protein